MVSADLTDLDHIWFIRVYVHAGTVHGSLVIDGQTKGTPTLPEHWSVMSDIARHAVQRGKIRVLRQLSGAPVPSG